MILIGEKKQQARHIITHIMLFFLLFTQKIFGFPFFCCNFHGLRLLPDLKI